jgi:hypothetical protein
MIAACIHCATTVNHPVELASFSRAGYFWVVGAERIGDHDGHGAECIAAHEQGEALSLIGHGRGMRSHPPQQF